MEIRIAIEQIQTAVNMDEFKKEVWVASKEGVTPADWKYNLNTIMERIWRGIRGQG